MMDNLIRIVVIILLFFLSLNAIGGSLFLIADPSGKLIQIPLELLNGTPFNNYLIPGIILLVSIGIFSLATAIATIKKTKSCIWLIIIQGCVLIGWLTIELLLNPLFFEPVLHFPLYVIGILLIVVGILFYIENRVNSHKIS